MLANTENTMEKHLVKSLDSADRVDIIVSFVMESGVRLLLTDLKSIVQKGVKVRILTGDYLGITEPGALYLLKGELGVILICGCTMTKAFISSQNIHISQKKRQ